MKRKQKEEIWSKGIEELVNEIKKKEEEILGLRIDIKMAKVKNTSSLRRKADELAAMKSILEEKKYLSKT